MFKGGKTNQNNNKLHRITLHTACVAITIMARGLVGGKNPYAFHICGRYCLISCPYPAGWIGDHCRKLPWGVPKTQTSRTTDAVTGTMLSRVCFQWVCNQRGVWAGLKYSINMHLNNLFIFVVNTQTRWGHIRFREIYWEKIWIIWGKISERQLQNYVAWAKIWCIKSFLIDHV